MTPLILAIAAAVVLVIGAGIMIAVRSRGEDEGARFRHVADITSTWSRQSDRSPAPYPDTDSGPSRPEPESDETAAVQSRPGRPRTKGR